MTPELEPKERAKEFFQEFEDKILSETHHLRDGLPEHSNDIEVIAAAAKGCALIAVEKLLIDARKVSKVMYEVTGDNPFDPQILYWNNVKEHLIILNQ